MSKTVPVVDKIRIEHTIRRMRDVRSENDGGKKHLDVARRALDEILYTKEYKFGVALFYELERNFTEIKPELEQMRLVVADKENPNTGSRHSC